MPAMLDRRMRTDRRQVEGHPPPGFPERRLHAERRLPAVREQSISAAEWQAYFGQATDKTRF